LFVPVSGPYGMGEFARCAAIAGAALERWPEASVHFLLSRQAPYVARVPYPVTLLPSSATFHSAAVIELMRRWRPDVVIFDNAGRSAQLRSAQRLGARVVFISSRRRQRRRAFRLAWMRLIDEHWIAYPRLIAGELGLVERAKLWLLRRPVVRYLDVIMARTAPSSMSAASAAARADSMRSEVVVIPGGGTGHPGAEDAARQFLTAARNLAAAGFATTFVGPTEDGGAAERPGAQSLARLACIAALPQADLVALMRGARLVIANGGSTLLQAIACGAPCVAAPIAGDQRKRIRACAAAGVAVEAAAHAADLEAKARRLLEDDPARAALARRAAALELADGIDVALDALASLGQRS
jgi:UDP:flavonoid glycosyltransferase YjiC (YdhE family)